MPPHHNEPLRQQMIRSLRAEGVKPVLARDLGDGPHRPFGSALQGLHGPDPLATPPLVGRTRRLQSEPPCSVCGNRSAWRCLCDSGDAA